MVAQQVCRRGGKWNQVADGAKKPLVTFRVLPPYNLCECRQNTQPFLINKNMGIYFSYITVFERMGRMGYLVFVLLGVLWDSWICGLISLFIYLLSYLFAKFLFCQMFFSESLFLFCSSFNIPITHMLDLCYCHTALGCSVLFFCLFFMFLICFHFFFSLCGNFQLIYPYTHWFFPWLCLI